MSTQYRYTLPVEQTEREFDGHTKCAFTWEYDDNRAGLKSRLESGLSVADEFDAETRLEDAGA